MLTTMFILALFRPPEADAGLTRPEGKLLYAVNSARKAHGRAPVRIGWRLQAKARGWARYLRRRGGFFHARIAGGVSENLGWVTCRRRWAGTLVRMWLNSYTHRPHLLDRHARYLGVGVSTGHWRGFSCVRMTVTRFR